MRSVKRLVGALHAIIHRRRVEAELDEELREYLAAAADAKAATGLSRDEARRLARVELGSLSAVKDWVGDVGWESRLESVWQDVRYAGRMVRRNPGFSVAAILTLMLGIGGNTAVFSLLDALLMRSLPVERPGELVRLVEQAPDAAAYREAFTLATHDALLRGGRSLSGVVASEALFSRPKEIEVRGERQRVFLQLVSDNYFDVLGVRAFRGRVFHQPGASSPGEAIAVISEDYWRRHYAADLSALGARFRFGEREFTITGIAPPGFRGTEIDVPVDIWVSVEQVVPPGSVDRIRGRWMRVMGRLEPGVTPARAESESTAILGRPVEFQPGGTGYSSLRRRLSEPLLLVALVVALVLLIACANLANLMLAATAARERELAVRTAIGASRSRILRQLLTESLMLSAVGGVLAVGVAYWISAALLAFLPPEQGTALPNLRFELNAKAVGFAALLSCTTCLMFGLVPALRATGRHGAADLRASAAVGQRNKSWLSRGLVVTQVVMCTALLTIGGVLLRSLQNLRGQETGFREDRLLVADVEPPREYAENRRDQLIEELRRRAAALPGVEIAAFSHVGQLSGFGLEYPVGFPGRPRSEHREAVAIEQRISPGFLTAMGTAFLAGRDVEPSDDARSTPVAIVNESFARQFLPGRNPIGERFFREGGSGSGELMQIVGVVKDSKWLNLRDDAPAMYYRPYRQQAGRAAVRFAIRTSGDPDAVSPELILTAQALDRRIMVSNVVPFREIVNRTLVIERLMAQVSAAFGVLALMIAAVGLYGVLAYSVVRRRREIGLRIAVGAPPGAVEWMFLRESLTLLACGMAIGLPAGIVVTRFVSSMLFGLSPHDPASIGVALSVLAVATVAAAYLPARRAAGIDPILALREE